MPRTYSNDDNYMMYTYKVRQCAGSLLVLRCFGQGGGTG